MNLLGIHGIGEYDFHQYDDGTWTVHYRRGGVNPLGEMEIFLVKEILRLENLR